jgi:hypothetical protein
MRVTRYKMDNHWEYIHSPSENLLEAEVESGEYRPDRRQSAERPTPRDERTLKRNRGMRHR